MKLVLALFLLCACDNKNDRRFRGDEVAADTATTCRTDVDCNYGVDWQCLTPGEEACESCEEPTRACESDGDCEGASVCRSVEIPCSCSGAASACAPPCRSDQECDAGQECDLPSGQCLPASCLDGFACPMGSTCTGVGPDHGCQPDRCSEDADCGEEGLVCVNQGCYATEGRCWPDEE